MQSITKFDKSTCKMISAEIEAALQSIAQKYGIEIRQDGGSLSDTSFTAKVKCTITSGQALEEKNKMWIKLYDLPENAMEATFKARGVEYKIVGFEPNRRQNNIVAQQLTSGKQYLFTVEGVRHALAFQQLNKQA